MGGYNQYYLLAVVTLLFCDFPLTLVDEVNHVFCVALRSIYCPWERPSTLGMGRKHGLGRERRSLCTFTQTQDQIWYPIGKYPLYACFSGKDALCCKGRHTIRKTVKTVVCISEIMISLQHMKSTFADTATGNCDRPFSKQVSDLFFLGSGLLC